MLDFYLFRGDTFFKTLNIKGSNFLVGDEIKIAIGKNPLIRNLYYQNTIEITEEKESIDLMIYEEDTIKLPPEELILEIELRHGPVIKTFQYNLLVKEALIDE